MFSDHVKQAWWDHFLQNKSLWVRGMNRNNLSLVKIIVWNHPEFWRTLHAVTQCEFSTPVYLKNTNLPAYQASLKLFSQTVTRYLVRYGLLKT